MSPLWILLSVLVIIGCDQFDEEAHAEECGTDWIRGSIYQFSCPYTVDPVQRVYDVGDTISVVCRMTDTIYCENSQRDYHIPDFPFRSLFTIWYFPDNGDVLSGLRHTTWELDSLITDRNYVQNSGKISDHIAFRYHGQGPGTGEGYFFSIDIVLDTVGKFILQAEDLLETTDINGRYTGDYKFDCMLPESPLLYQIKNRLTHEDHLDDYLDELAEITRIAYNGDFEGTPEWLTPEFFRQTAGFAFEVR